MADWLDDFVAHTSYGETPARVMWWIGVSTIAGALRRKVFIDQNIFQWSPNFYLLIIGEPGVIMKSTSIGLGLRLLRKVDGIDFGPQSVTWQQMVTHMADAGQIWKMPDGSDFEMSCCTIALSEFGSFFKRDDDDMITNLTDMWDGKLEPFRKETKTNGNDEVVNPWINIMACATPDWVAKNFSSSLVGEGFGSRPIYLLGEESGKYVAYPADEMPSPSVMWERENDLVDRLRKMAEYAGPYQMTAEAKEWGKAWYEEYRRKRAAMSRSQVMLVVRKQTHLHKIAMVLSASRGKFPVIDVEEMIEAEKRLADVSDDAHKIFGYVGQSPITSAAREVVAILSKNGKMLRKKLYRDYFFRTMKSGDFDEAIKSARASGLIGETGDVSNPMLELL